MEVDNKMVEATALVEALQGRGVTLRDAGGKVGLAPAGVATLEEKRFIVQNAAYVLSAITGKPLAEFSEELLEPAPVANRTMMSGAAWVQRWVIDNTRRGDNEYWRWGLIDLKALEAFLDANPYAVPDIANRYAFSVAITIPPEGGVYPETGETIPGNAVIEWRRTRWSDVSEKYVSTPNLSPRK
jgi:hypothetical protein